MTTATNRLFHVCSHNLTFYWRNTSYKAKNSVNFCVTNSNYILWISGNAVSIPDKKSYNSMKDSSTFSYFSLQAFLLKKKKLTISMNTLAFVDIKCSKRSPTTELRQLWSYSLSIFILKKIKDKRNARYLREHSSINNKVNLHQEN